MEKSNSSLSVCSGVLLLLDWGVLWLMQMLFEIVYLGFVICTVMGGPLSGSFARKGFIEDKDSLLANAPQIQQTLDISALVGLKGVFACREHKSHAGCSGGSVTRERGQAWCRRTPTPHRVYFQAQLGFVQSHEGH